MKINVEELINAAKKERSFSYCPYSDFSVGAALLTKSGKIYVGCNVENKAFSPGICAERTAVAKAVSEGEKDFVAIAVVGGKKDDTNTEKCMPCGVCRQVLNEFCSPDFLIISSDRGEIKTYTLGELLPESF